jgi:flavoprotein
MFRLASFLNKLCFLPCSINTTSGFDKAFCSQHATNAIRQASFSHAIPFYPVPSDYKILDRNFESQNLRQPLLDKTNDEFAT